MFEKLKGLFNSGLDSKQEETYLPVDDKSTVQQITQKDTQGVMDSDVYGIGYGDSYVERVFQLTGLTSDEMWERYVKNEWVRSCIDKIIKECVKYRLIVKVKDGVENPDTPEIQERIDKVNALLHNPNKKVESFSSIRRKYLRDILVYDAGALEIVYNREPTESVRSQLRNLRKQIIDVQLKYQQGDTFQKKFLKKEVDDLKVKEEKLTQKVHTLKAEEETGKGRVPVELYDLKGPKVKLNVDKHGNFNNESQAYKLMGDDGKIVATFGIDELIYYIANPISGSVYGLSPIETIYNTVLADEQAAVLNRRRLENDGMISGVLSLPGMSPKKLKSNQMYWRAQARKKGARLVITSSKDVKFTKVVETHQEMQFMEYQKWTLQKIMAVYGMQPIVLGVIDPTTGKLNSDEQRRQFKADAIIPLLELESHHLTDVLVQRGFGYDDIEITYQEPHQEMDLQTASEVADKGAKYKVITKNEFRELIGLQPLDEEQGGDLLIGETTEEESEELEETQAPQELEEERQREEQRSLAEIARIRNRVTSLINEIEHEEDTEPNTFPEPDTTGE